VLTRQVITGGMLFLSWHTHTHCSKHQKNGWPQTHKTGKQMPNNIKLTFGWQNTNCFQTLEHVKQNITIIQDATQVYNKYYIYLISLV